MRFCLAFLLVFVDGIASRSPGNLKGQKEPQKSIEAFDQRQSGKYNFVFNVKDVQLIKLDSFKVGDDYSYGDYADYPESDYDYDPSNLTTSPIWAYLTDKPTSTTTKKPKTTTAKTPETTTASQKIETTTVTVKPTTTSPTVDKISESSTKPQEILNESEDKPVLTSKPALDKATTNYKIVTESMPIDYEEIPVQVIYERRKNSNYYNQQQQQRVKGINGRRRYQKKPAIEIIDPGNLKHNKNVEVIDSVESKSDPEVVVMCSHNEYLDSLGRCRTRRFKPKHGS